MTIKVSKDGLLIPKEYLEGFDEVVVIKKNSLIIIKPANLTDNLCGRIRPVVSIDDVMESYDDYILERGSK